MVGVETIWELHTLELKVSIQNLFCQKLDFDLNTITVAVCGHPGAGNGPPLLAMVEFFFVIVSFPYPY